MVQTYKPLYTVKDAAKILLVTPNTLYDLMNTGKIPYLVLGSGKGTRKIRGSDLERFIETYPTENYQKRDEECPEILKEESVK